ncbi:phosphotransacetylase [Mycoplasmopsis columbinasalis]|uniref:Phosphate acetyltransferase(Phosphotransacetylase) n=1 Tax=Mycoplasmopsis columbinasalis TaxID=114880 RepID=A0A449BAL4_9BACT|nr:phosphotransacetylase [Mycoplasmopsis columbinasalis]VEU78241.1 phosphate acetyltransferase(phosphotransacetylase) [Mycoplasmopsis columbinasalis]
MSFINLVTKKVNELPKTKIVLIDGADPRAIDAAKQLAAYKNLEVSLLVETDKDVLSNQFINIFADQSKLKALANDYKELRNKKDAEKGKPASESDESALQALSTRPFYAMMLLLNGEVDAVVGGLNYSTADILRAAFKTVGPKPGVKTISSVMIMHQDEKLAFFSDISVNPDPTKEMLVDIATNAAAFVKSFDIDPKIAFLSFSTNYSAKTPRTELVHEATFDFNAKYNGTKAIGEVQLDAALDLGVRASKYKMESFNEPANTLIFPNLEAGNIGYKLVQRYAGYGAIGPIITGVNKPVNDLSRGAKTQDVVETVLITAIQAHN